MTRLRDVGMTDSVSPDSGSARGIFQDCGLRWRRVWYLVCTATQFAPRMGSDFRFPACGRPRLRDDGPLGSETLLRNSFA